jgi:hypothetical protein
MTDVLKELYEEFPEIDEKSIDKICKAGISGINKLMRSNEELRIDLDDSEQIKFFIPCSPETQDEITKQNIRRRRLKETIKQNGQKS